MDKIFIEEKNKSLCIILVLAYEGIFVLHGFHVLGLFHQEWSQI